MTSQPIETIPEEPTPAPARVTADPPKTKPAKNPGRVASGKRLAERNRLAREALARETLRAEAEAETASPAASASDVTTTTANDNSSNSSLSLGTMLGIGTLIVGVAGLYYEREAIMARLKPAPPPPEPTPEPAPSRIPVKRGLKKMD